MNAQDSGVFRGHNKVIYQFKVQFADMFSVNGTIFVKKEDRRYD